MTVAGTVIEHFGKLTARRHCDPPCAGARTTPAADVVGWDIKTRVNSHIAGYEASAFTRLSALTASPVRTTIQATGPLKKDGAELFLDVQKFEIDPALPQRAAHATAQTRPTRRRSP